jgi:hypothetical protein
MSLSELRRAPLCARNQPLSETGPPSSHSRQSVPQTTVFPQREPANIPGHPSGPTFPPSPSHLLGPMSASANSCAPAARIIAIRSKSEQRISLDNQWGHVTSGVQVRSAFRLPKRLPEGTKYVVESCGPFVRRFVELPNGNRIPLPSRKALTCTCADQDAVSIVPAPTRLPMSVT